MDLSRVTLEIFTHLENKWLSRYETTQKTRILSIDGGGTSACIAGAFLIRLEDQIRHGMGDSQARIADFFDIVSGTGIGAFLAAMIVADDGSGRPLFTARDAVGFIEDQNANLYKKSLASILCVGRRRFSGRSMEKTLKEAFKELTLKDTCKPLLVPCLDLKTSAPFVFSRADAWQSPSFDFELWKVCRATSATPGLFKPFALTSVDGKTSCSAVDGGLVMNNPTAAAVTHVLHNRRDFPAANGVEDLLILSLGNGTSSSGFYNGRRLRHTSRSFVDIVLDGVSETVDQMLGHAFLLNRADYVRIQSNGLTREGEVGPSRKEEIPTERGIETAPFGRRRLLTETNGQRIDGFVQRLVALRKSSVKEAAVSGR